MSEQGVSSKPAISLYTRADIGWRSELIRKLERIEEEGRISEYEVNCWPAKIDASSNAETMEIVKEFEEWAVENEVSLEPFFDRRELSSSFTGKESEVLVLPAAAIAVYSNGEIAGVYPCSDGETVHGVEDYLNEIEMDEEYIFVSSDTSGRSIAD